MRPGWCGQSCSSTSRVFLHQSLHDKVVDLVLEKVKKDHTPGDPLSMTTTMGSLIDGRAVERVKKYVEIGKSEGAKLVLGGSPPELPKALKGGFYFSPTIFLEVKQSMRIAQEEIFGPVMSVINWTDEEELWKDVNSVEYGLTGAIYSTNTGTAHKAAKRMEAGYIWINNNATHFLGVPFGGVKQSGMGREHDLDELYDMTQSKSVHLSLDSSVKNWT
jgi:betaine-aldehyde dehydrogenase